MLRRQPRRNWRHNRTQNPPWPSRHSVPENGTTSIIAVRLAIMRTRHRVLKEHIVMKKDSHKSTVVNPKSKAIKANVASDVNKSKVTTKYRPKLVATSLKPVKLEHVSIEQLCIMELLSEEHDRAELEGRPGQLTLTRERYEAKIAEKKREKKETAKSRRFSLRDSF
jgi:hypothetical protein